MCLQYVFQSNADVAVNIPFSLFVFFFLSITLGFFRSMLQENVQVLFFLT